MGLSISSSQLDEVDLKFLKQLAGRVFSALAISRSDWMADRMLRTEQDEIINLIQNAEELNIQSEVDVVRFVGLAYAPSHYRSDPLSASVITRTLNRLDWDGGKRLDFIYRNVIDNPKVAAKT